MANGEVLIAVVIPCFRAKEHILGVIAGVPPLVQKIIVIDDACPDHTGQHVRTHCRDARVEVLSNSVNLGVGGATIEGYKRAIEACCSIVVKIDGDGQMDGALIPYFVAPILNGQADYTKGNRFYNPSSLRAMPALRLAGNAILSFATKLSSGYWDSFDPANGFIAVSVPVLKRLPLHKLSRRYFFESDMLFRLNTIRAVLVDVPLDAVYAGEISSLHLRENIWPFIAGNIRNVCKRILYNYYLRNFSLASLQLMMGVPLLLFGLLYGLYHWHLSAVTQEPATAGTVMVSALPIIMGVQLLLSFLNYDINTVPRNPLSRSLQ